MNEYDVPTPDPAPTPSPTPTPSAVDTVKKDIAAIDGLLHVAAKLIPGTTDDEILAAVDLVVSQDWFAELVARLIKTPAAQRAAVLAHSGGLV